MRRHLNVLALLVTGLGALRVINRSCSVASQAAMAVLASPLRQRIRRAVAGIDARLATTCKRIVRSTSDPALLLGLLTVSNSKPDDVPKFPSAMGVATRLACSRAVQEGVKVELLLREAGLTRQQIDDPGVRLDVKNQIRFLELVATAVKDDLLGFHLALKVDLRKMGATLLRAGFFRHTGGGFAAGSAIQLHRQ